MAQNQTPHLPAGTLLQGGKYKIERFISSGGFGCTYEARHVSLGARVAIKEFFVKDYCDRDEQTHLIRSTQAKQKLVEKLKRKFIGEAQAVFKMRHENIVRVTDQFEENGTAYFVMDFIEGQSLAEIVKERGPLPEAVSLGYIRQVASALGYVHDQNRFHLDVKPGNIMVDASGRALLIDFGASKQYEAEGEENTSTITPFTIGYAPVEQSKSGYGKFDASTDIYALGATFYKLLTGQTPPNSVDLMSEDETLAPLPTSISPSTRRAIECAMQLKRKDRTQSIEEFLQNLSQLDGGATQNKQQDKEDTIVEKETASRQSTKEKPQKPAKQKRFWRNKISISFNVVMAILVAVVILITAYNLLTSNKADVQNEEQEYEYVMNNTDVARMKRYLETFTDAPRSHRDDVQARLSMINQELRDWEDVLNSNNINAFKRYLEENPESPYANVAIHKIDSIDWTQARLQDNSQAYEAYLREHPNGEHTTEARRHAADTKTQEEIAQEQQAQEEQPAAQTDTQEATDAEKKLCDEIVTRFVVSINKKIPENFEQLVRPTMDNFLGEKNATTASVIAFVDKLWTNTKNLNWRIDHGALAVTKSAAGDFTVKFPATLSKRSVENKDSQEPYQVMAKIDPNRKIFYLTMSPSPR